MASEEYLGVDTSYVMPKTSLFRLPASSDVGKLEALALLQAAIVPASFYGILALGSRWQEFQD